MVNLLAMRFASECVGTALLMCLGCMGCISADNTPLHTSLHMGLVVMILVHCFGFVSGAHVNPTITLACYMFGYITASITVFYMLAQFLGALIGYLLLALMVPDGAMSQGPGLCMTVPESGVSKMQAFGIEFMLTTTLIFGWSALWDVRCGSFLDSISLRIGLLVTSCCLAGGQFTGASMNPARTLAPCVYHENFEFVATYFGSQFLAAVVAPFTWRQLFTQTRSLTIVHIAKSVDSKDSQLYT